MKFNFDKFKYINTKEILREILVIFLGFIYFFGKQYSSVIVIKNLSPLHVIFSIPIVFLLKKIILLLYTKTEANHYLVDNNNNKRNKFFLDISGDIISVIGFLIYL